VIIQLGGTDPVAFINAMVLLPHLLLLL
jgi:hypothetical protein